MDYGLVGYWNMDEGSGTTAYDASGNGNNGTIYGAKWTTGKFGSALSFDGVDDYVEVPGSVSLDITGPITVEAWVYPRASGVSMVFAGGGNQYVLWVQNNNEVRLADTRGNYVDTDSNVLTLNAWNHVVGVFSGVAGDAVTLDNAKIYINGISKGTHTGGIWDPQTLSVVNIGREVADVFHFNGLIDEVRIYNRALSEEEIRYHYNRGGPVAYWKFDEGSGTTAYDSTENNNDGTITGPTWTTGKFGTALSFDGVDDYVEVPDSPSLDITDEITLMAWVKREVSDTTVIFKSGGSLSAGTGSGYKVDITADGMVAFNLRHGSSEDWLVGNTPIPAGEFAHIAVTFDGSMMRVYLNGHLDGEKAGEPAWVNDVNVLIGHKGWRLNYFNGLIDDVRIYNYARTPDEIRLDYNAGFAARFGPTSSCDEDPGACMDYGLVGYWNMDEGSGTTAYDASGNGNNGTIYGNGPLANPPAPSPLTAWMIMWKCLILLSLGLLTLILQVDG
jgi:hypothetical protein